MKFKTIAGLTGLIAVVAFLAAPAIKLHKIPLIVVALMGAGMVVYEFIGACAKRMAGTADAARNYIAGSIL